MKSMKFTLNGEARELDVSTVGQLVRQLGLSDQAVAVELNRQVVPRRQHATTPLADGDAIEVVTLVGGG